MKGTPEVVYRRGETGIPPINAPVPGLARFFFTFILPSVSRFPYTQPAAAHDDGRRRVGWIHQEAGMRVTVCELGEASGMLERDWTGLVAHVRTEGSELVLLPEMPFADWFARTRPADPIIWRAAVTTHEQWLTRLGELAPAVVLGTRPVNREGRRYNEGFIYEAGEYRAVHHKYYLPDEEGYWEASWYERGDGSFRSFPAGPAQAGFLICTDLWFLERARAHGRAGAHLLLVPRATMAVTTDKWLAGGRTAAVVAGAFCLSSNRRCSEGPGGGMGGTGWIIDPEGGVLGVTSPEQSFLTLEIDLTAAEEARTTYPRYVPE
jgi:predicted amidohydrolase